MRGARVNWRRSAIGSDEAGSDREAHEAGEIVDIEPLHDLTAMRFYGLNAQ
jgi:hypothetical protein